MAAVVEIRGLNNFLRTLRKAGDDLTDLKEANAAAAAIAAGGARALAPVVSGALFSTIRSSGTKRTGVIRAGGAKVPYAGPINYGWHRRHITPTYFMNYGAQNTETQWVAVYFEALDKALDQVKGI